MHKSCPRKHVSAAVGACLFLRKGAYDDALFKKNNTVEILLHENLGGGFSPPAAHKIRRNGRKARNHGIDRTPYMSDRKMSASTLAPSPWASPSPSPRR